MKRILFCFLIMLVPYIVFAAPSEIPMKKASLVWWPKQAKVVFEEQNTLRLLKEKLASRGYDLEPQTVHSPEKSDIVLVAYPHYHVPENIQGKAFLWLLEPPISLRLPLHPEIESRYQKIFTYNKQLALKDRYVALPIPYNYPSFSFKTSDLSTKHILVAQVAGYFKHGNPKNNYAERGAAVTWFLKNHPNDIFVAGWGKWNTIFRESLSPELRSLFDKRYKGVIKNKIVFLRKAKFALAYENTLAPDYVSEKIYDVMAAGTVPIYQGAPNIEEYVPKACFINRNDFESYEELYNYLKNMPQKTYLKYINCIIKFMSDSQQHINAPEIISDIMLHEILDSCDETTPTTDKTPK